MIFSETNLTLLLNKIQNYEIKSCLMYGQNSGLSEIIAKQIKTLIKPDELYFFDYQESEKTNFNEIYNILSSNLFASKILIKLYNVKSKVGLKKLINEISNRVQQDIYLLLFSEDLESKVDLVKTFNDEKHLASFPCYLDDEKSAFTIIKNFCLQNKITLNNEIILQLSQLINGDRMLIMNEMEKILIYFDSLDDLHTQIKSNSDIIFDIITDQSIFNISQLSDDLLLNNKTNALYNINKALAEGVSIIQIIKFVIFNLNNLMLMQNKISTNKSIDEIIREERIFFKRINNVRKQLQTISFEKNLQIQQILHEIEQQSMNYGEEIALQNMKYFICNF